MTEGVILRPYAATDHAACLAIFDSNMPLFFAAAERGDFENHLDNVDPLDSPYLVIEAQGAIVACGGLTIDRNHHTASLSWGMVDRRLHRQQLGKRLVMARLDAARNIFGLKRVTASTSQHSQGFYARQGFVVVGVTPNGLAEGLDRVDMELILD